MSPGEGAISADSDVFMDYLLVTLTATGLFFLARTGVLRVGVRARDKHIQRGEILIPGRNAIAAPPSI